MEQSALFARGSKYLKESPHAFAAASLCERWAPPLYTDLIDVCLDHFGLIVDESPINDYKQRWINAKNELGLHVRSLFLILFKINVI